MKMQKDWREDNWKAYDSKCYLPVEHVANCKRKKSWHVTMLHGQVESIGVWKQIQWSKPSGSDDYSLCHTLWQPMLAIKGLIGDGPEVNLSNPLWAAKKYTSEGSNLALET